MRLLSYKNAQIAFEGLWRGLASRNGFILVRIHDNKYSRKALWVAIARF
jgi:hypothetical protein